MMLLLKKSSCSDSFLVDEYEVYGAVAIEKIMSLVFFIKW